MRSSDWSSGVCSSDLWVDPGVALIIGLIAGVICAWSVMWLKGKMHYDDALAAFGVHAVGGFVGAILTGVFAVSAIGGEGRSGLFDGNAGPVWIQFDGKVGSASCRERGCQYV